MADNAEKALKLAQANEKQVVLLWKKIFRFEKAENERERQQNEWEKKQMDYIQQVDKALRDYIAKVEKNLVDAHNAEAKRSTDLHNEQAKEMKGIIDWAKKTFEPKD